MTSGLGTLRILLPKGFYASGVNCGVRRYRPDLGLIFSDLPASAAGVFTRNHLKAAPIVYSQALLPNAQIRAIVTNSGQANAATGADGEQTNQQMVAAVAKALAVKPQQVLSASTGVIGEPLQIDKIVSAVPELVRNATDTAESFALAILTTDLVPKTVTTTVALSTGVVRISGISKGSGMIHPNMGTMLGYLLTDAQMTPDICAELLKRVNARTFNMISVDGEVSTNDCVFLLANGASGVAVTRPQAAHFNGDNFAAKGFVTNLSATNHSATNYSATRDFAAEEFTGEDLKKMEKALTDVAQFLAMAIARDGEGAAKLIETQIIGQQDEDLLRRLARGLTISPLIKTAMHGEDPNWGRIIARLGADGASAEMLAKASISLQDICVFSNGSPQKNLDRDHLRQALRRDTVVIRVEFSTSGNLVKAWGCDLTKKYVEINAEYTT